MTNNPFPSQREAYNTGRAEALYEALAAVDRAMDNGPSREAQVFSEGVRAARKAIENLHGHGSTPASPDESKAQS